MPPQNTLYNANNPFQDIKTTIMPTKNKADFKNTPSNSLESTEHLSKIHNYLKKMAKTSMNLLKCLYKTTRIQK